jgi:hypothetical protein
VTRSLLVRDDDRLRALAFVACRDPSGDRGDDARTDLWLAGRICDVIRESKPDSQSETLLVDPLEHQATGSSLARIQLSEGVRTRPSSVL